MVQPDAASPFPPEPQLTHLDAAGRASMVDVSAKAETLRIAVATARVVMEPTVRGMLFAGTLPKGEALGVARVAGIQGCKETARLIPLCHPLALSRVVVDFAPVGEDEVLIRVECRTTGRTGVEMEAMTGASVAALCLYDMVKGLCRGACIAGVQLETKSGGKSGDWRRSPAAGGQPGR